MAVDHPVIERARQVHPLADLDPLLAVVVADDHRRLLDLVHPQDRHLGVMDDRRGHQAAVLARQADRLSAEAIDQHHELLLDLTGQHPLDDLHRLGVGHPHALDESGFLANTLQGVIDLRPAAMHDDRPHSDELQKHDIVREAFLQRLLCHRIAAVLDDDRATVEAADVGKRLGQDFGLQLGRNLCTVHRWWMVPRQGLMNSNLRTRTGVVDCAIA